MVVSTKAYFAHIVSVSISSIHNTIQHVPITVRLSSDQLDFMQTASVYVLSSVTPSVSPNISFYFSESSNPRILDSAYSSELIFAN